jgi:P27 family predicted phage terminase small subunit
MAGYKGAQGRKPLPTAIKKLAGTYRADRANPNEPESIVLEKLPRCPAHLKGQTKEIWKRTGQRLITMRVLTEADLDAFEDYCRIRSQWQKAMDALEEYGLFVKGREGQLQRNPAQMIVNTLLPHVVAYQGKFGLTPSDRSRVSAVVQPVEELDPFDEYLLGPRRVG